jgi:flagellar biosynthesis/type III secretory pathway protein FliH
VRLGARLDEVIESIARSEKPFLKKAITEVFEEAYKEGYADGRADCSEESMDFLAEETDEE